MLVDGVWVNRWSIIQTRWWWWWWGLILNGRSMTSRLVNQVDRAPPLLLHLLLCKLTIPIVIHVIRWEKEQTLYSSVQHWNAAYIPLIKWPFPILLQWKGGLNCRANPKAYCERVKLFNRLAYQVYRVALYVVPRVTYNAVGAQHGARVPRKNYFWFFFLFSIQRLR